MPQIVNQVSNKNFPWLLTQHLVEMKQEQGVSSERFNDSKFLRQRINQGWHPIRHDHCVRVPVKSYNQCGGLVLARISDGLPDDLLMTQMHPIEKTNCEAHP